MKKTDSDRIYDIRMHGNSETRKMGEWINELVSKGEERKAAKVLRVAERMLMVREKYCMGGRLSDG